MFCCAYKNRSYKRVRRVTGKHRHGSACKKCNYNIYACITYTILLVGRAQR